MELNIDRILRKTEKSFKRNSIVLAILFGGLLALLCILIYFAPDVDSVDNSVFYTYPSSNDEILKLTQAIQKYTEESYFYVVALFCFCYIFLQSFAIPGPIILSIISGAIFGRWLGLLYVITCATVGSTFCYLISNSLGAGIIIRLFPSKIQKVNQVIKENKEKLFFYLLFLRIVPLVPNFLINLASPIIGIPLKTFVAATFFGLLPPNFVHISTGMAIQSIQQDGVSSSSIGLLILIGAIILIPIVVKKNIKVKI